MHPTIGYILSGSWLNLDFPEFNFLSDLNKFQEKFLFIFSGIFVTLLLATSKKKFYLDFRKFNFLSH